MSTSRRPATRRALDIETISLKSSIEALKLQVSATNTTHQLQPTKSILLSILQIVRPHWNGIEDTVLSLIKRIVDLSMNIFILVEMAERTPISILEEFTHALEAVKRFVISANRCMSYPYPPAALQMAMKTNCRALDRRLESIICSLEAAPQPEPLSVATSSSQSSISASSTFFPDANDFTIKHSQFYSAPGGSISVHMEGTSHLQGIAQSTSHAGLSGLHHYDDLELEKELYKGKEYRLHQGRARGKAVVVKVFQGPRAKQLCLKTAEFNRSIMHSNLLRMLAGPNRNSESSFIVFDGDYQGTVESQLANALRDGVKEGCVMGAQTVIACSLGLDYLQELGLPFPLMGPEHFVLMVAKDGRTVVSFDADVTWDAAKNDSDHLALGQAEKVTEVCNELIQKTFYTSCKAYYRNQGFYDEPDGPDEILAEIDDGPYAPEDGAEQPFNGSEDMAQEGHASRRNSLRKAKGHRRELIWKSQTTSSASLNEIGRNYQVSLTRLRSELGLVHWHGCSIRKIAHRCPGYKRTEIILTPVFEQSGIVSHTSPVPDEICSVCQDVHLCVNNSTSSAPAVAAPSAPAMSPAVAPLGLDASEMITPTQLQDLADSFARNSGHSTPPETSVSSITQPLQHHVLTHPIRRPRTSTTVFQSSMDLAAYYGIPQMHPPPPRRTPRVTSALASKDSSPAIPDFQALSSNYLNMLKNKPTDTSVAAPSVPAMSSAVAPSGLDAPEMITPTQLQDLADFIAASPAFRDSPGFRDFDDFVNSPLVLELDNFGTSPLETPYSDFLLTPLFSDDAMLTSPNMDYADLPLFADTDGYSFTVEQVLSSKTNAPSTNTGIRKGITPDNLLDESAPTQPRKYTTPSATSRKEVPTVFARKRSRVTAFGEDEEDQLDTLPPNPTEQDLIEQKRRQNTIAARRSRKRKLEQFQMMEQSRNSLAVS